VVLDGPERSEESHCGGYEIVAFCDPPQVENLASEILFYKKTPFRGCKFPKKGVK
jgi:hypothetical protein